MFEFIAIVVAVASTLTCLVLGLKLHWSEVDLEEARQNIGYWKERADQYKKSMEYWHDNDNKLTYENKAIITRSQNELAVVHSKAAVKNKSVADALAKALELLNDGQPVQLNWTAKKNGSTG